MHQRPDRVPPWLNWALNPRSVRRRQRLAAFGRRGREVLLMAGVTGALTGLAVAGFEWVTRYELFNRLQRLPVVLQLLSPAAGLLLTAAALRWVARTASPSTADEYVRNIHQFGRSMDLGPLPGRILASVATLGLGAALGYEGPSIYLGAGIGSALQSRFRRVFSPGDAKVLMVAGAAAGVAAIFRAPATGVVFALEAPFQDGIARRMLLPAGISAATSYIVFVAFFGTSPLVEISGSPALNARDLVGAVVLGVVCGLGARVFTQALVAAEELGARLTMWTRVGVAGVGLAGLAGASYAIFGRTLTLGAGYDNIPWALDPRRSLVLVTSLLVLRAAAVLLTVGGEGVGGLFIPLVIEGALLGRAVAGLVPGTLPGPNVLPLIGASAFLGAGYRVPLAAVVFVAEASGRAGFIAPGLIAVMVAQLFMSSVSASPLPEPSEPFEPPTSRHPPGEPGHGADPAA